MKFKQRLRRLCFWIFMGFVLLFVGRLGYGYYAYPEGQARVHLPGATLRGSESVVTKRNYAGVSYKVAGRQTAVDQKYEKIADLSSASSEFGADDKKAREEITAHNGIIQFENGRGTKGDRYLHLVIGVPPDNFDKFCTALRGVGRLLSMEVSKTDKTNEFLDLKAQRASLEKTRGALLELRMGSGNIEELMKLQNRILEIEGQLQNLGVSLGDFDETNAFCTVRFSLHEDRQSVSSINFTHRVYVALTWAALVYAELLVGICLIMLAAFLTLVVVDKCQLVRRIADTLNETGLK